MARALESGPLVMERLMGGPPTEPTLFPHADVLAQPAPLHAQALASPAREVEPALAENSTAQPLESDEFAVIARAQQGDRRAFQALYQLHAARVYQVAIAPLIADKAQREDILGETFLRALENLERFRWQGCGLLPWLTRIAKNLCLDHLRRRKPVALAPEDFDSLSADETVEDAETLLSRAQQRGVLGGQIDGCLRIINPRYALVIRLRCIDKVGRTQAAEQLGVSIGTLDVLYFRACRAFRKAFADYDPSTTPTSTSVQARVMPSETRSHGNPRQGAAR